METKPGQKCVIYSRVSTQEQSTESQVTFLQRLAEANGLIVEKIFEEKISGYDQTVDREVYDEMKEYVIKNGIKQIYIWEISRLSRNTIKTLKEIEYFKENGVNIFFQKESLNTLSDEPSNQLMISLLSTMAQVERNTFIARTSRGKRASAEKGKIVSFGIMPYGFHSVEGKLAINPKEAEVVREIYQLAAQDYKIRGIATILNSKGIPTRHTLSGRKRKTKNGEVKILWRGNTVRNILKSTLYKGERHYKDAVVPCPAIVSEDLWNEVYNRFKENRGNKSADRKYEYLLKGKIKCGSCGLAYMSRTEPIHRGRLSYYFCSGRKDKGIKCNSGSIKSSIVDKNVYEALFSHPELMERVHREIIDNFDPEERQDQILFFEDQIKNAEKKLKRSVHLFKEGLIDDKELKRDQRRAKINITDYQNQIRIIKKEIETFQDTDRLQLLYSFIDLKDEKNFTERREIVQKYIDLIIIYKVDNNEIDFSKVYSDEVLNLYGQKPMPNPHGNDKLIYLEIFALGNPNPIQMVMANVSPICLVSKNLSYYKGRLRML